MDVLKYNTFNIRFHLINNLDKSRGDIKKAFVNSLSSNLLIYSQLDAFVETLSGLVKPRITIEYLKENLKEIVLS